MSDAARKSTLQPDRYVWSGQPLGQAHSLPAECYTSPAFFKAEMANIHLRNWFFVGREDELPNPGDYRAVDTVGGSILLVRDESHRLRAFGNFCRHRGSQLLTGCGNARLLICPYHAWSYRLDGSLRAAPVMRETPGFEATKHGLIPVRMEIWQGLIFLNFDAAAPDLTEHLGNLPELLGSHRFDEMVCVWRKDFDAKCNWKLLLENAMETYHTGIVHAATVGAQTSVSFPTRGNWKCIQVQSTSSVAVLDGTPPFPVIEGLSEQSRQGTYFTLIHPTTQFACAQDCMWWLTVRPIAHDRSILSVGGAFPRATTQLPNFERDAIAYYDRWERVAREDVGILELQQQGLRSHLHRPGPLCWRDDQVHAIGNWVLSQIPEDQRPDGCRENGKAIAG